MRGAERPGLELQAYGAGITARPQRGQERFQGEPALAGQAMLVTARLQVRVGQMYVTELGREDRVGPEDVDLAGPGVTGIQRHVTHVREVLGQVAALPPDTEHACPSALRHVLDGHDDTLVPRLA